MAIDERLGPLTPVLVRDADHRAFQHRGVGRDGLLDLDAGDVLAAGDDDVLAPVAQLDVPVRVPHGQVTGVGPAAGERLVRGGLVGLVAAHHVVAAHDHFPHGLAVPEDVVHLLVDHAH